MMEGGEDRRRRRPSSGDAEPSQRSEPIDRLEPGYRQRRRAEERARQKAGMRRGALAILALLVIALAVFLLWRTLGGDGQREDPPSEGPPASSAGGLLLVVEEAGEVRAAAFLHRDGERAVALGIPTNTLVEGRGGFDSFDALYGRDREEALEALAGLMGAPAETYARIDWQELYSRAREAAPDETPSEGAGTTVDPDEQTSELPASLIDDPSFGAGPVAWALANLAGPGESAQSGTASLTASEGEEELRNAIEGLRGAVEETTTMPGRLVEGAGFVYFEPDLTALQALLGTSGESAVEVEVQNGSGVVGIAEAVAEQIAPLGYSLLPTRNADQFPDVETTQIFAARDALSAGERVREAIGIGRVIPRDELPPGRIVVVVGHDLTQDEQTGEGG